MATFETQSRLGVGSLHFAGEPSGSVRRLNAIETVLCADDVATSLPSLHACPITRELVRLPIDANAGPSTIASPTCIRISPALAARQTKSVGWRPGRGRINLVPRPFDDVIQGVQGAVRRSSQFWLEPEAAQRAIIARNALADVEKAVTMLMFTQN